MDTAEFVPATAVDAERGEGVGGGCEGHFGGNEARWGFGGGKGKGGEYGEEGEKVFFLFVILGRKDKGMRLLYAAK